MITRKIFRLGVGTLCLVILPASFSLAGSDTVAKAKADLLATLADYAPATAPDPALTRRIDQAAAALEQAAGGPPDLRATPGPAGGLWLTLFSSQGIFGDIDLAFMTRALLGGGEEGGTARIEQVLQELRPADRFYRNTMVMSVGPDDVAALYFATADLGISATQPNDLEVSFRRIEFVPGRADVSTADLRMALRLPPTAPLAIDIPISPDMPASVSTVTYLDDDLRINRGKDYIAVMQKLR